MRAETPEEKYDRLRLQIQNLVLAGYPNPDRKGCPGNATVTEYAQRAADWEEIEGEADYEHITHCSPCYREFLDERSWLRAEGRTKLAKPMSWFKQWRLGRTLDKLEAVMKSVLPDGTKGVIQ